VRTAGSVGSIGRWAPSTVRRDWPTRRFSARCFRVPGSDGSCVAALAGNLPAAPGLAIPAHAGQTGATVTITPGGAINASTYNTGSFVVTNSSGGATRITGVRIDLTTALFPDLVFDPNGTAGDTVAKCFTDDGSSGNVGLVAPADPCVTPFDGPHDGGYDTLQIDFSSFSASRSL